MRTTFDIPEPIYRAMRTRAASEGTTMREIILEGVAMRLRMRDATPQHDSRPRFPVIKSRNPGSLKLGQEGVYEYIPFP